VSKRRASRYIAGRSDYWLKVKNPDAPAVRREAEEHCRRMSTLTLRHTVFLDGEKRPDDYKVRNNGRTVGRIYRIRSAGRELWRRTQSGIFQPTHGPNGGAADSWTRPGQRSDVRGMSTGSRANVSLPVANHKQLRDMLMRGRLTITCPICGKGQEAGVGMHEHVIRCPIHGEFEVTRSALMAKPREPKEWEQALEHVKDRTAPGKRPRIHAEDF
jgi:hypothetical protein